MINFQKHQCNQIVNIYLKAGYLGKTFISGSYEIKTKIPENLTSSKLEKIAYPHRFNKK